MAEANVLLLSQRRIADLVAFCVTYEFEDTFAAVTDAERIDATDLAGVEFSRRVYKLARLASGLPLHLLTIHVRSRSATSAGARRLRTMRCWNTQTGGGPSTITTPWQPVDST